MGKLITIVSASFIYILFFLIIIIDTAFMYGMVKAKEYKTVWICISIFIISAVILFAQSLSLLHHG
jgi:uncharacterized membrane protein